MKNAHPYTGKWLREVFPEQTKSPASIVLWTLVFLVDAFLIFWGAWKLGLDYAALPYRLTSVVVGLGLGISLALFWAETAIYNRIVAAYRKTLE